MPGRKALAVIGVAIVAIVAATVLVVSMDGEQRTVIADGVVFHPQYGTEPNYDYFESETGNGVEPCIFIDAEDMKWIVTASAHFETGDGYKLDSITFSISFPDGMIFQEMTPWVDGIPDRENSSDGITGYAKLDGMTYTAKYDYGGSFEDDPPNSPDASVSVYTKGLDGPVKVTYSARFVEDAFLDRESETIEGSFILYTDGFVQTTDSI